MRRAPTWAIVVAAFGLSSCSPPTYHIVSFAKAGHLHFDVEFEGSWPFKWKKSDAEATYLEVVTTDEILWAIKASDAHHCTQPTATPDHRNPKSIDFPIGFGEAPRCFQTLAAPKRLPKSRDVLVRSKGWLTEGAGVFRIESGKVINRSYDRAAWKEAPSQNGWWQAKLNHAAGDAGAEETARID